MRFKHPRSRRRTGAVRHSFLRPDGHHNRLSNRDYRQLLLFGPDGQGSLRFGPAIPAQISEPLLPNQLPSAPYSANGESDASQTSPPPMIPQLSIDAVDGATSLLPMFPGTQRSTPLPITLSPLSLIPQIIPSVATLGSDAHGSLQPFTSKAVHAPALASAQPLSPSTPTNGLSSVARATSTSVMLVTPSSSSPTRSSGQSQSQTPSQTATLTTSSITSTPEATSPSATGANAPPYNATVGTVVGATLGSLLAVIIILFVIMYFVKMRLRKSHDAEIVGILAADRYGSNGAEAEKITGIGRLSDEELGMEHGIMGTNNSIVGASELIAPQPLFVANRSPADFSSDDSISSPLGVPPMRSQQMGTYGTPRVSQPPFMTIQDGGLPWMASDTLPPHPEQIASPAMTQYSEPGGRLSRMGSTVYSQHPSTMAAEGWAATLRSNLFSAINNISAHPSPIFEEGTDHWTRPPSRPTTAHPRSIHNVSISRPVSRAVDRHFSRSTTTAPSRFGSPAPSLGSVYSTASWQAINGRLFGNTDIPHSVSSTSTGESMRSLVNPHPAARAHSHRSSKDWHPSVYSGLSKYSNSSYSSSATH